MISVQNLEKNYGDFKAVRGLSFSVRKGEIFGIVGANGAGKTTILKSLAGLVEPTSGSITMGGLDSVRDAMAVKKRIGFLPEDSPVYEDMDAESYLRFFAEVHGIEASLAKKRIRELLEALMLEHQGKKLGDMSKGMKRKVMIARSLINDPEVLIYDEPSSGLDPMTSHFILNFVKSLKGKKTVVLSTHNLFQAEALCDNILVLKKGEMAAFGTVEELKQNLGGVMKYAVHYEGIAITRAERCDGHFVARDLDSEHLNEVLRAIASQGGRVLRIDVEESSLEEVFVRMMQ